MSNYKHSLLTLAIAAAGFSCSISAEEANQQLAQQEDQVSAGSNTSKSKEEVEVIEVKGFSSSLIKSLNDKRFADTVVESISADDLGALPDVSMADALTRLPGISAVRTGGQASEINIRGMAGGFVFSTLNGREQVSTSGQRNIEFDQYPSELISSASVYKSPKVSLIEGGVAGTVELKTASPLKAKETHNFTLNARGMYNDRADEIPNGQETGDRFSLSYQGKFLEETLGVAFGFARLFQPSVSTQFVGLAYNKQADVDGISEAEPNELISEGFEMQHRGGEETRNGYMAAIEWIPTDKLTVKADAFLSKFDTEAFARGFRVKLEGDGAAIGNPVINDNLVIGGTFNRKTNGNTRVELVNDDNTDNDEVKSFGFNVDFEATDELTLNFDVSHSSADSVFKNGLLWALVAEDATVANPVLDSNVSISYQLNGLNLPDVGFNQEAAFIDVNRVMVSKYGIYPYINSDEVNAYKLDGKYELDNPLISSLEAGVRYSEREYSNDRQVFEYGSDGSFLSSQPPLRLTDDMVDVVNFSGKFSHFPSYLAIDADKALNAWFPQGIPQPMQTWGTGNTGILPSQRVPGGPDTAWSVLQSGEVYEDVMAAYVMASLDTEFFSIPVTGNIGVRMVKTDQYASDLTDVGGDATLGAQNITDAAGLVNTRYKPGIIGQTYRDYLPQMNLNFAITDSDQIRFAAAKVMSRPPIDRLASNTSYTIDALTGQVNGSSSNSPFLKPFYATQYDISYEKYFTETDGAFVAAVFYKDIESFINTFTITDFDFAAAGFPIPQYVPGTEPGNPDGLPPVATTPGNYTTAVNNDTGGYIRGAEIAYTQVLKFLPSFWQGLGFSGSYSYTESEIQQQVSLGAQTIDITLPGLSKNVMTATVFWEYEGFETRISGRYRDNFVSEQVAVEAQTVNFDGETVIDYQASYQINDNFGVLFQVNNLTDEPTKSYFGEEANTGTIQFFGRQYFVGANYRF